MRTILIALVALSCVICAEPSRAQTKVQSTSNWCSACGTTGRAVAFVSNLGAGHLIVALSLSCFNADTGCGASQALTITDTLTHTWTSCHAAQGTAGQGQVDCWFNCSSSSGADTVTLKHGSNSNDLHLHIFEYSGVATSVCNDASGVASSTSATPSVTTSGSVAQSNELVLAIAGDWATNQTATAGAGFTLAEHTQNTTTGDSAASEDNNTRTGLSGTQTASFGALSTDTKSLMIVTFKGSGAGAPTPAINKRKKLEQLDDVNLRRKRGEEENFVRSAFAVGLAAAGDGARAERIALSDGERLFGLGEFHGESFGADHAGIGQPDFGDRGREQRSYADAHCGFGIYVQRADDGASVPGDADAVHRADFAYDDVQRNERNADGDLSGFAPGEFGDVFDLHCAAGERARFECDMDRIDERGGRLQRLPGDARRGPYTKLNTALVSGLSFSDTSVVAGKTYFYVTSAVDAKGNESVFSNESTGKIPTP